MSVPTNAYERALAAHAGRAGATQVARTFHVAFGTYADIQATRESQRRQRGLCSDELLREIFKAVLDDRGEKATLRFDELQVRRQGGLSQCGRRAGFHRRAGLKSAADGPAL